MIRIVWERNLDIDEELRACFKDQQKAVGRVKRTNLKQILKETSIVWRIRKTLYESKDKC
jgi:hypothetical protein